MTLSVVVDWDGTATERDTQWMILEEFGDPGVFAAVEEGLQAGELTHLSDRCAAQAAVRIFARGGLAEYLARRGVPFEPFDDLRDVSAALS